jgi:hypothetical protein
VSFNKLDLEVVRSQALDKPNQFFNS